MLCLTKDSPWSLSLLGGEDRRGVEKRRGEGDWLGTPVGRSDVILISQLEHLAQCRTMRPADSPGPWSGVNQPLGQSSQGHGDGLITSLCQGKGGSF